MTVMEAFPDWRKRDIRILATDINNRALKKARDGVYGPWAMRVIEKRYLDRYFTRVGTTLFNMAVNRVNGKVYVTNTEARNEVRFEGPGIFWGDTVRGHNSDNRISVLGAGGKTFLVLEIRPGALPRDESTTGLYHIAILVPDRPSLAGVLARIAAAGVHLEFVVFKQRHSLCKCGRDFRWGRPSAHLDLLEEPIASPGSRCSAPSNAWLPVS